jgi:LuxR family quorum-sensing system transcriptional regulator SolR
MELHWKDALERFRTTECEQQLFKWVAGLAQRLGFEHCCYGIRVPLRIEA